MTAELRFPVWGPARRDKRRVFAKAEAPITDPHTELHYQTATRAMTSIETA
ncbi:hypothetical protein [Arthrobacter sp. StoSoilB5]|uniref:hypothetical protein n=1 Tax=Arthrobacter sp. StoSoilB5 TaxID=2830992 RepID=UPI001CC4E3D5|nr:hypothetical protein [Arthrobacter sp. StoSoilB5]